MFFFFQHTTSYVMRISDWSSDVCSSDLWGRTIIATGPLTAAPLAEAIRAVTGEDSLAFFDAIAPIVYRESIDMETAWFQSRWNKGDGLDYINCPMTRDQYQAFVEALLAGEKTEFKEWEQNTPYFEGCMPVEVMAAILVTGWFRRRFGWHE